MAKSIEQNTSVILQTLAEQPRDKTQDTAMSGSQLAEATELTPPEINDAVTILIESGLAEWQQWLGTGPYVFGQVSITPRGRYEYERLTQMASQGMSSIQAIRPPVPVGSPYGFSDEDWEIVAERKARADTLFVVLGHQFQSEHYDSNELRRNIEAMFLKAVNEYNQLPSSSPVHLEFHPLAAGYGEHLFNEIARDIIAADIALFEMSDLNPNVMLEMGVALTWGVRVLPIKAEGQIKPPSDVSGQTWADYRDSAETFIDHDHERKLVRMVERAIRKKARA
jgi:DNA-binding MarR family transcriptional regulator